MAMLCLFDILWYIILMLFLTFMLNRVVRKQLAYMLGRQYVGLELNDEPKDKADLTNIMSNSHINEHFNSLAREVSLSS